MNDQRVTNQILSILGGTLFYAAYLQVAEPVGVSRWWGVTALFSLYLLIEGNR